MLQEMTNKGKRYFAPIGPYREVLVCPSLSILSQLIKYTCRTSTLQECFSENYFNDDDDDGGGGDGDDDNNNNMMMMMMNTFEGYSSGQSHLSEINVKLTEENEFVIHSVKK